MFQVGKLCLEITKRYFLKTLYFLVHIQLRILQNIWSKRLCEIPRTCSTSYRAKFRISEPRSARQSSQIASQIILIAGLHYFAQSLILLCFWANFNCKNLDDGSQINFFTKYKNCISLSQFSNSLNHLIWGSVDCKMTKFDQYPISAFDRKCAQLYFDFLTRKTHELNFDAFIIIQIFVLSSNNSRITSIQHLQLKIQRKYQKVSKLSNFLSFILDCNLHFEHFVLHIHF